MPHSTQPPTPEDIRQMLRDASAEIRDAERERINAVAEARAAGMKWDDICDIAGISRPTAIRYAKIAAGEVKA